MIERVPAPGSRVPVLSVRVAVCLLLAAGLWAAPAVCAGVWPHRWHPIEPSPGHLGVRIRDVTPDTVRRLDLPGEFGAFVEEVIAGSPAEEAGLEVDDVIIEWNDQRVESVRQLIRMVKETPPGRRAQCRVVREGAVMDVDVVMAPVRAAPGPNRPSWSPPHGVQPWHQPIPPQADSTPSSRSVLGLTLQSLTPQLAQYFGVGAPGGALISSVQAGSAAAAAGLRAGDVLVAIDQRPVRDPDDAHQGIRSAGEQMVVDIVRDRRGLRVTVRFDEAAPAPRELDPQDVSQPDNPVPPGAI